MRLQILTALIVTIALGLGCSNTRTLTLLSTRNVDLSADHEVAVSGANESEVRFWLLFIPFAGEPDAVGAATTLLEKQEGDYLTNVEVKSTGWSLLAVSWGSVTVKGDVYRLAGEAAATPAAEPSADAPATEDTETEATTTDDSEAEDTATENTETEDAATDQP